MNDRPTMPKKRELREIISSIPQWMRDADNRKDINSLDARIEVVDAAEAHIRRIIAEERQAEVAGNVGRPTMPRTWVRYESGVPQTTTMVKAHAEVAAHVNRNDPDTQIIEVTPRTPATDVADDAVAALRDLTDLCVELGDGQTETAFVEQARAILARVDGGVTDE